jgi:signal transduction histidine kinase
VTELDVYAVSVLTDLHEDVLQRVFATGLGLQSLVGDVAEVDEALAARLRRCIADLDETLDEIRMTMLDLRRGPARAG